MLTNVGRKRLVRKYKANVERLRALQSLDEPSEEEFKCAKLLHAWIGEIGELLQLDETSKRR